VPVIVTDGSPSDCAAFRAFTAIACCAAETASRSPTTSITATPSPRMIRIPANHPAHPSITRLSTYATGDAVASGSRCGKQQRPALRLRGGHHRSAKPAAIPAPRPMSVPSLSRTKAPSSRAEACPHRAVHTPPRPTDARAGTKSASSRATHCRRPAPASSIAPRPARAARPRTRRLQCRGTDQENRRDVRVEDIRDACPLSERQLVEDGDDKLSIAMTPVERPDHVVVVAGEQQVRRDGRPECEHRTGQPGSPLRAPPATTSRAGPGPEFRMPTSAASRRPGATHRPTRAPRPDTAAASPVRHPGQGPTKPWDATRTRHDPIVDRAARRSTRPSRQSAFPAAAVHATRSAARDAPPDDDERRPQFVHALRRSSRTRRGRNRARPTT